ncbi:MAG TPA: GAF domain-containing protein [Candidatus Binatia bacterium]|jgi:two-component system NtrC family sensor kinase|nr:GAF domain-containing protein [Candidatus Binatia bacterium]
MSGERILVVDDSREIVKHLTEYLLPNLGYEALAAYDGREGLEMAREHAPDLMMLDLNLPEMTGLDVLQVLAADGIEIPVVLMTGYGSEKDAIEAFRLGIKDYLVKPFTIDEVGETIARALQETRLRHDNQRLVERLRRAEGDMRRQIKEMRTLYGMGKGITSSLHLNQVLDQILQSTIELTTAERATLWLPDRSRETLYPYTKAFYPDDAQLRHMAVASSQVGRVFTSGEPLRQAMFGSQGIKIETDFLARAILYVPLTLDGKVMGVLGASNHDAPRAFSERDELLLSALSDFAAIGLRNAQTYQGSEEALATHLEELETMLRITRTITSSLDLDEVSQLTIQEVHGSWDIEASSIWLLDETRQDLRVLVNVGTSYDILSRFRVEVGDGIVGHVVKEGEPLFSNDVANHPLHFREIDEHTGFKTRSIVCVPLVFNQEIIGALQLLNKRNDDFTEEDVQWASSIATAVAIAVSNARLFAEAASRQQLLEATLEHNGNPVFITDLEGRLLLSNRQARERFGLSEGAIGRPAKEVVGHPKLAEMLAQRLHERSGAQRRELEMEDGSFWLSTMAPIPDYGQIAVLQDITYLKELDTAKSNFVATVSHDLRAPLNSISGFATSLAEVGPLNERQSEFVERIVHSSERMMSLVSALLDLARVDSRMEQVRQSCDLTRIVRSVLTDLQGQAMTRKIELALDCPEHVTPIQGDPTQLRQAVSNLVDNAIKYSERGQTVQVSLHNNDEHVLVRVSDRGPGIPAADIPHIFEKFYQVKGENQREGAGLGLTLVRSIAEAHGGWVSVESEQSVGSTFTLQLPARRRDA